jgi:hypothetical protein
LLGTAPGVFVARGEDGAIAQRCTLHGFDAGHGQDIEMRIGGLPIDLPSHIHGQGYALLASSTNQARPTPQPLGDCGAGGSSRRPASCAGISAVDGPPGPARA